MNILLWYHQNRAKHPLLSMFKVNPSMQSAWIEFRTKTMRYVIENKNWRKFEASRIILMEIDKSRENIVNNGPNNFIFRQAFLIKGAELLWTNYIARYNQNSTYGGKTWNVDWDTKVFGAFSSLEKLFSLRSVKFPWSWQGRKLGKESCCIIFIYPSIFIYIYISVSIRICISICIDISQTQRCSYANRI